MREDFQADVRKCMPEEICQWCTHHSLLDVIQGVQGKAEGERMGVILNSEIQRESHTVSLRLWMLASVFS